MSDPSPRQKRIVSATTRPFFARKRKETDYRLPYIICLPAWTYKTRTLSRKYLASASDPIESLNLELFATPCSWSLLPLGSSSSIRHVSLPTSVHYREYYFTGHIRSSGLGTIASFSARVVIPLSTQPSTRPRTVSSLGPSSSQSILSRDIIIFVGGHICLCWISFSCWPCSISSTIILTARHRYACDTWYTLSWI